MLLKPKKKKYYDSEDPEIYDMVNRLPSVVDPVTHLTLRDIDWRQRFATCLNIAIKYGYIRKEVS